MTEEVRCKKYGLLVSQCSHCRGLDEKPKPINPSIFIGYFPAKFSGYCAGCGEPFEQSAMIQRNDNGLGWVGTCCGGDSDILEFEWWPNELC